MESISIYAKVRQYIARYGDYHFQAPFHICSFLVLPARTISGPQLLLSMEMLNFYVSTPRSLMNLSVSVFRFVQEGPPYIVKMR